jgi:uncharacterized membrane protein
MITQIADSDGMATNEDDARRFAKSSEMTVATALFFLTGLMRDPKTKPATEKPRAPRTIAQCAEPSLTVAQAPHS